MACWHADMTPDEIAAAGRMLQESNVLSAAEIANMPDRSPDDGTFVHPDEVRGKLQAEEEEAATGPATCGVESAAGAHVLVATDAALKLAPEVCHPDASPHAH